MQVWPELQHKVQILKPFGKAEREYGKGTTDYQ